MQQTLFSFLLPVVGFSMENYRMHFPSSDCIIWIYFYIAPRKQNTIVFIAWSDYDFLIYSLGVHVMLQPPPLATMREGGYGCCSCHLTWWWFNFSQVGDTVRHMTMATTETIWRETIQELFLPVLLSASAYQVWLHCLDPKTIFLTLVTASVWNLLSSMLICVIKCRYEGFSWDHL